MSIKENINKLRQEMPENVKLVAVSKTKPNEAIIEAYEVGQRIFGENKVQDLVLKHETLNHLDIKWHFIGHLQTNKVKFIAPFVNLIHGVDSIKLLKEINKQAIKNNRKINCLLQFHIASEDTKFGLNLAEAEAILDSSDFNDLKNVNICGIMGMASYTDDKILIRKEFAELKNTYDYLREKYFVKSANFIEISMGMSSDWAIAISQGSTLIRVGSIIFGKRN